MGIQTDYKQASWYLYLKPGMRSLVRQSFELLDGEKAQKHKRFEDYSFIVFPLAKAYEGFLKQYFFDLHLISQEQRDSRYFRIGRSLNPDLPHKYRDETWFYDDLEQLCDRHGVDLAQKMWNIWIHGRNVLFHYFYPDKTHFIDVSEAEKLVATMTQIMDHAVSCGILEDSH